MIASPMRAALLLPAVLGVGCLIDLDHRTNQASTGGTCKVSSVPICMEAAMQKPATLTWLRGQVFAKNCFGANCHSGATAMGKLDLIDAPYTALMGADGTGTMANLDASKKRVVAADPAQSYLFFIIHGLDDNRGSFQDPPTNVGFMPMANDPLCCQKIDAIASWITAGANND